MRAVQNDPDKRRDASEEDNATRRCWMMVGRCLVFDGVGVGSDVGSDGSAVGDDDIQSV